MEGNLIDIYSDPVQQVDLKKALFSFVRLNNVTELWYTMLHKETQVLVEAGVFYMFSRNEALTSLKRLKYFVCYSSK